MGPQHAAPLTLLEHLEWTLTDPPERAQVVDSGAAAGGNDDHIDTYGKSEDGNEEDWGVAFQPYGSQDGASGGFSLFADGGSSPGPSAATQADRGGTGSGAGGGGLRGEPRPVGPRDLDAVVFSVGGAVSSQPWKEAFGRVSKTCSQGWNQICDSNNEKVPKSAPDVGR